MDTVSYALFLAAAAIFGTTWSLKPAGDLRYRLTRELVFRAPNASRRLVPLSVVWGFPRKPPKSNSGALLEVSDIGLVVGLALANGETPVGVLDWVSQRVAGRFGHRLRQLVLALRTGSNLNTELTKFAKHSDFEALAEMLDRLTRSAKLGTDVSGQVQTLAESSIAAYRVQLLAKQSRIELRMLVPLVFLILPTTILFAVFPSLHMLQLLQF